MSLVSFPQGQVPIAQTLLLRLCTRRAKGGECVSQSTVNALFNARCGPKIIIAPGNSNEYSDGCTFATRSLSVPEVQSIGVPFTPWTAIKYTKASQPVRLRTLCALQYMVTFGPRRCETETPTPRRTGIPARALYTALTLKAASQQQQKYSRFPCMAR